MTLSLKGGLRSVVITVVAILVGRGYNQEVRVIILYEQVTLTSEDSEMTTTSQLYVAVSRLGLVSGRVQVRLPSSAHLSLNFCC